LLEGDHAPARAAAGSPDDRQKTEIPPHAYIKEGAAAAPKEMRIRMSSLSSKTETSRGPAGGTSHTHLAAKGVELSQLRVADLDDMLELQDEVISSLQDQALLCRSSIESLLDCLDKHFVLGAREDGRLVAAGILLDAGQDATNIQRHLTEDADIIEASGNIELILVAPRSRGLGVAKLIVELLGREASARHLRYVLCTIHPNNEPSQSLFGGLGYQRRKRVTTSYGARYVFQLNLSAPALAGQSQD
jgi:ribosomal protein S18 acetylase RimI-like enzyme